MGDEEIFKSALYEQKRIKKFQQERIDEKIKAYLATKPRVAKESFPLTSLSDSEFSDILRAIQLKVGDDFETLLVGQPPPASFNNDVRIFESHSLLADPVAALIALFVTQPSTPLTENQ